MQLNLHTPNGHRSITINKFPACTGYFIEQNYKYFLSTEDQKFREKFLYEVLSFAKVVNQKNNQEINLSTSALIDNHLGDWKNLSTVFEEVLKYNDIELQVAENQKDYWDRVGEKLAISFIANTTKLLEPFVNAEMKQPEYQESSDSSV